MSPSAQRGLNLFLAGGLGCTNCHVGPELTAASVRHARDPPEPGVFETMNMADNIIAIYDIGYYNIGLTATGADQGRGASDPFGNPLSFSKQRGIVNGSEPGTLTFSPRSFPTRGVCPLFWPIRRFSARRIWPR